MDGINDSIWLGLMGDMMTTGQDTTIEEVINAPPAILEILGSVSEHPVCTGTWRSPVLSEKSSGQAMLATPTTFDGKSSETGAATSQNPAVGGSKRSAQRDIMFLAMTRDLGQGQGVVLSLADNHRSLDLLQGQQIAREEADAALLTTTTPVHPQLSQTRLYPVHQ